MEKKLNFTYEPGEPGEAYISLDPAGKSKTQIVLDNDGVQGNENFRGEIIIDLNAEGKIVGIEILGDVLPEQLKIATN